MWFGIEVCVVCTTRSSVRPGKCTQSQLLLTEQNGFEASDQEQLVLIALQGYLGYLTLPYLSSH